MNNHNIETIVDEFGQKYFCNTTVCAAVGKGEEVQFRYKNEEWKDFDAKISGHELFGPWIYQGDYEWRVKPSTIKIKYRTYITENENGFNVKHVSYELPVSNMQLTENNMNFFTEIDDSFKHWISDWTEIEIEKDV